jgi:putative dimethyl sulfoxide reductase chaperone
MPVNTQASARADAQAAAVLLAHWWSRPVADEVASWLGWSAAARQIARDLGDGKEPVMVPAAIPDDVPALLDDYERLFVGPAQVLCPPYESCWRDDVPIDIWHSLMGPCTADLRELYRCLDVDTPAGSAELPDHIAVEFEALAYALSRPDGLDVARTLLTDHLARWLPRLCKGVAKAACLQFYRDLAAITPSWLAAIAERVAPTGGRGRGA